MKVGLDTHLNDIPCTFKTPFYAPVMSCPKPVREINPVSSISIILFIIFYPY